MIRSLRTRLTVAIGLITLLASAVVGVGLGQFTRTEFEHFLEVEAELASIDVPDPARLVERLRAGDLDGARVELSAMARHAGDARLLLFAPTRELVGQTRPGGHATLHADGSLEVLGSEVGDQNRREERLTIQGGLRLGRPDERLGTLFVLPTVEHDAGVPPAAGFHRRVGRAHLLGILIATALALVIALALSRHILGPVETLTRAARRLARGDLGQRVSVRSRDEIGELTGAFNAMAESLERQETVRRNMVSDIAHELRTPLTHLRCKLESLQDGLLAPGPDVLSGLTQEIAHLGRLVDDLQELALAEAGRLRLYPTETDLEPLARQVVKTLPTAEGGPSVVVEVARDIPPVRVDVDRFRQVLRNLLQNALRHGAPSGHVTVRVASDHRIVRCEVEDDGPGIPAEHLERIFDRFHRTDPSRDRATGGAGLGLAIARQLVLAWNGAIGVESPPGRGARFWFTVPTARAGESPAKLQES